MTGKLKAYLLVTSEILTCSVVTNYVQTREPPFFKKKFLSIEKSRGKI